MKKKKIVVRCHKFASSQYSHLNNSYISLNIKQAPLNSKITWSFQNVADVTNMTEFSTMSSEKYAFVEECEGNYTKSHIC